MMLDGSTERIFNNYPAKSRGISSLKSDDIPRDWV